MTPGQPTFQARTGRVLLAGFGGLLALMAVGGFDAIQIRSSLYLSGTVVRDYLLDPEPQGAEVQRAHLERLRHEMEPALDEYSGSLSAEEQNPLRAMRTELAGYWKVLDPILRWSPAERRERGYTFLRDGLVPRRASVLGIADRISAINEQELNGGDERLTFRRFRGRLFVMLAATLSIGLVLAGVVASHILRLEKQSRFRYEQVMRVQTELKELSARLVKAQEEERRAISRELHDEVGQSLSALLMDLGNLAAVAPRNLEPLQRHLESIRRLAESSVNVARNMALLLRPSMLDDFGLVPALEWHAREVSKRTGMAVSVEAGTVSDTLSDSHNTCVYRVVQEALHNCARHAQAHTVRIRVRQDPGRIVFPVQDDGKGFNARHVRGLGLVGMEERVAHLGGTFQVKSEPGKETLVLAELPYAAEQPTQPVAVGQDT